jgi:hypothetical protein
MKKEREQEKTYLCQVGPYNQVYRRVTLRCEWGTLLLTDTTKGDLITWWMSWHGRANEAYLHLRYKWDREGPILRQVELCGLIIPRVRFSSSSNVEREAKMSPRRMPILLGLRRWLDEGHRCRDTFLDLIARGPKYLKGNSYQIELSQRATLNVHASGLTCQTSQRFTCSLFERFPHKEVGTNKSKLEFISRIDVHTSLQAPAYRASS